MKDKILSVLFVSVLFVVSFVTFFKGDIDVSFFERRKLVTSEKLKEDFVSNLDQYLTDQFVFRDEFISLNSIMNRYVFLNKENNGVYLYDDYLIEKNYPLDRKSVESFISKLNLINDKYLKNSNNVFLSVIPDKSYFLSDDNYLKLDLDNLVSDVLDEVSFSYINLLDKFVLEDYYKGDIHIKQESYFDILSYLDKYLDFNYSFLKYDKRVFNNFYGASVSKVGSYFGSEDLNYFSNDILDNVVVSHLEFGEKKVYDVEKLESVDAYNVFLSGPSAVIDIENSDSLSDKELVIFRDSFGSSLAPLLVPFYKKITLVDLRYISMNKASNYVNFDDKDVLFLYSTLIINNSNILKVD